MKYRYLMFGYDWYYPSGGMSDLYAKSNDKNLIREYIEVWKVEPDNEIVHVYDSKLDEVVYMGQGGVGFSGLDTGEPYHVNGFSESGS